MADAWALYTQRASYSQERGFSEQPQFLLRCVAMVGLPFQTGSDRAVRKRVGRQRSRRGKQFGERRPQCGHARPNPDVAMSKTMKTLAVPAGQMVSWVQACFWLFCCFTDWLVLMGVYVARVALLWDHDHVFNLPSILQFQQDIQSRKWLTAAKFSFWQSRPFALRNL